MVVIGNSLNPYFNLSKYTIYDSPAIRKRINLSLTFSFYNYCLDPIDLIDRIVKSRIKSISILSIHDIIPTIIKTKKYYNILKQLRFIKCSNKANIINQIIEVNYVIYNKYILFHLQYINYGKNILLLYKKEALIGIHVRLYDKCLISCNISMNYIFNITSMINRMCKNKCKVILSSFSIRFNEKFQSIYKNIYIFNPSLTVKHSFKSKRFDRKDVEKTVMDIHLTSSADYLILSGRSTFSLLILYKGYYRDYEKCIAKEYHFINNIELYDHLANARIIDNCKNISILF